MEYEYREMTSLMVISIKIQREEVEKCMTPCFQDTILYYPELYYIEL
jgi:hypothetical protein